MKDIGASNAQSFQPAGRGSAMSSVERRRKFLSYLVRAVSGVSFPLAGSVIVIYTLSGDTRQVAIIATVVAVVGHVIHSMMELADRDARRAARADNHVDDSEYDIRASSE